MSHPLAILCSGQGGQHASMFRLTASSPLAEPVFREAGHVLGDDPRSFVQKADRVSLYSNHAGQILCCTAALAAWYALRLSEEPDILLAGYSVGELASWGCAGLFDLKQFMHLVSLRAAAMDRAAPEKAGLLAISGIRRDILDRLLSETGNYLAIKFSEDGFVAGGKDKALDTLAKTVRDHGARSAHRLAVSVPAHTPYLKQASADFLALLHVTPPGELTRNIQLLSGLDGGLVRHPVAGCQSLCAQISETINWTACVDTLVERGATVALELGPGRALSNMTGDRLRSSRSLEDFDTLEGVRKWLACVL
ncbi:ACP S-malonyltransferase [Asaia prunellae]|uniref:hypothetical protein n=1 Tax=Asaia prunellae TaxID=610245 RepID=UPI00046E7C10|nr:hypothetical protein [Asaia prunellae]